MMAPRQKRQFDQLVSYTQRLIPSQERVVVGATGSYEARCRPCYELYVAEREEEPAVQLTIPQPVA